MKNWKNILQSKWIWIALGIITFFYGCFHLYEIKQKQNESFPNEFTGQIINYHVKENQLTLELKGKEKTIAYYFFKNEEEQEEILNQIEYG